MNDSEFDQLLRNQSRLEPVPEAPFRRAVWQRIDAHGAKLRWYEVLAAMLTRPMRPVAGIAGVALTILAGVMLGRMERPPAEDAQAAYLASITPASHVHHTP